MTIPAVDGSSTGTWKSIINTILGLINAAVASRPYVWANSAARLAQTGMTVGEYGYQTDTQVTYRAISATTTEPWASPWITWSTAPTNIAIGTGGSAALLQRYRWVGGRLLFGCSYTLGSSGASVTGTPTITLPFNIRFPTPQSPRFVGNGNGYDLSAVSAAFPVIILGNTAANSVIIRSESGTGFGSAISNLAPFAWAAGDILAFEFWADPA